MAAIISRASVGMCSVTNVELIGSMTLAGSEHFSTKIRILEHLWASFGGRGSAVGNVSG